MNVIFRSIFSIVQFILLLLIWILAWVLQVIAGLVMFSSSKYAYEHVAAKIFRTLNWLVMDLLNVFWSIKVLRPFPKAASDPKEKYIVMFNHLSNADPWVVLRVFIFGDRDLKFASKGSLFNVPFGGWCMSRQGDMPIKFTKEKGGWGTEKGSVGELMKMAVDQIEHGASIAVFPEGVRNHTPEGGLGEFKAGFFDLALEHGYKILPVAISGSEKCWPVHSWQMDSATVYITCGEELVDPKGHNRDTLIKVVRDKIHDMRESHPDRKAAKKEN